MSFDLARYAGTCGVPDPENFALQSEKLQALVLERNQVVNLTRITGDLEFKIKHIADSLSLTLMFPELTALPLKIADLGCGGGFPSLVLALAFPHWHITAIDSTRKKLDFVAQAACQLNLNNLQTIHSRIEELNRQSRYQGTFDLITARAVAPGAKLYALSDRLGSARSRYIFYKTPSQAEEDLAQLGTNWKATSVFDLPEDSGRRTFVYRQ